MANGIARMIQGMPQFQPVSSLIGGMQAGQAINQGALQNRLAQAQLGDINQKNQLALRMQQARGLLPNPETRQQGIDELTRLGAIGEAKSAQDLYTRSGPKFGRPIQAMGPDGKPVWVQVADTGDVRPVQGYGPMPKGGLSVTLPDGTRVQMGGEQGAGLQKPTVNKIEERQLDTVELKSRMMDIKRSYKPEYLRYGTSLRAAAARLKDKAGISLDPEDRKLLNEYSTFRQYAASNLNKTIQEITGAAMGVEEARRLTKQVPDPGQGLFDGDSPEQFEAKMNNVITMSNRAMARYHYAMKNGLDPLKTGIDLADVDKLIDQRGQELEQVLKQRNPGASQQEIEQAVSQQLKNEFGL